MSNNHKIENLLNALAKQPFRAKFHLGVVERKVLSEKGLETVRKHAFELISKRVAPAAPINDGKQTPYRGHPVFVAQHATATCCRTCIERWHHIPKGYEMTKEDREYVVAVIERWFLRELSIAILSRS